MTPDERDVLRQVGNDLLWDWGTGVAAIMFYGLLSPITFLTVWDLARRDKSSWATWGTLLILAFALLNATAYTIVLICIPHLAPQSVLIENGGLALSDRYTIYFQRLASWAGAEGVLLQLPACLFSI
ncbi:hypothetical protein H0H92_002303 [Tricholoma furcatifolium]|nr:hypothetical protein H0H92_002303 [Tricholoma furcatifolium]